MNTILVGCALLEHQGKFLLVQQARSRRHPLKWGPPGGKPDKGETIFEAVRREALEEIGQPIVLGGFVGLVRSGHQDAPNLFVCLAAKLADPASASNLKLKEGEITDSKWLTLEEIESGIVPLRALPFVEMFRRYKQGNIYPLEVIQHEPLADD